MADGYSNVHSYVVSAFPAECAGQAGGPLTVRLTPDTTYLWKTHQGLTADSEALMACGTMALRCLTISP